MARAKVITEILEAYKKLGRKPIRGNWFGKHREVSPLCAWAIYNGAKPKKKCVEAVIIGVFGKDYLNGFESKWSGIGVRAEDIASYTRGRNHAKQVEDLLRKEGILK